MAEIIAILVALWLLGIISIPWFSLPTFPVLQILGYSITIQRLLLILLFTYLALNLGSPFRQIIWVFFVLWLLSILGLIAVGGMAKLLIISLVVGLILSLVQRN